MNRGDTHSEDLFLGDSRIERPLAVEWVTGADGERYLLSRGLSEHYSPLAGEPTLHAKLARLEPAEGSIAEFVLKYGWLGVSRLFVEASSQQTRRGEQFSEWVSVLSGYRALWGEVAGKPETGQLLLMEAGTEADAAARAWQWYFWSLHDTTLPEWRQEAQDALRLYEDTGTSGEWVTRSVDLEPQEANWYALNRAGAVRVPRTNNEIDNRVHARDRALARALHLPLQEGLGASLRVHDDRSGASLYFEPKYLLAVAYLQIAEGFTGNDLRHSVCEVCDEIFMPDKRTKDQKNCSLRCRQKRYVQRRDEAYRLSRKEGLPPDAVVSRMEKDLGETVTTEQVEGWIRAAEKRKGKGTTRGSS